MVYEATKDRFNNNPILTNALFGAIKTTKNASIKKHIIQDMELDLIVKDFIIILLEELEEM